MRQRSSHNWNTKSGVYDSLNTDYITFTDDYPILSSIFSINDFTPTICNNYKAITPDSLVSMFVDDYILERFWRNPANYIETFKAARYVMSPDFSLLVGMPRPMQEWNVYRNRLVGYVWQQAGVKVIPTVSWSDERSFEYAFMGIEPGGVVAVSNTGCRNDDHIDYFIKGFNAMSEAVRPKTIVFQCNKKYRWAFSQDNVIFVDSFWDIKRMNNGR